MNGPAQPGTPGPESTGGTDMKLLGVYLNDHLAGATAGAQRIGHLARTMRGSALGRALGPRRRRDRRGPGDLAGHHAEPGSPRAPLQGLGGLGRREGGPAQGQRPAGAALSAPAPCWNWRRCGSGVEGKAAVWSTLRRLASTDERLDAALLDTLLDRAARQQDTVEEWRGRAAEGRPCRPTARAAA